MFEKKRIRIHGIVQEVGFRAAAVRQARELGVTGWIANAPDGSVEAEIAGAPEALEAMLGRLRHGPEGARVDSLRIIDDATLATPPEDADFRIV